MLRTKLKVRHNFVSFDFPLGSGKYAYGLSLLGPLNHPQNTHKSQ